MRDIILVFVWIAVGSVLYSCSNEDKATESYSIDFNNQRYKTVTEENTPNLEIHEGLMCRNADTVRVLHNSETAAIVILSNPVTIVQATKWERWGYYQFPKIYRSYNNNLIVRWQMKADSHTAYGNQGYARLMSRDEGVSWEELDEDYFAIEHHRCDLKNGNILQIETPESKDINSYSYFPSPVNKEPLGGSFFYYHSQLPEELQGTYLTYWERKTRKATKIHAKIDDPMLLRYAIDGLMPITWWGDIKEVGENTFVAGVYPTNYINAKGNVLASSVTFYKSVDGGHEWKFQGKIPYFPYDAEDFENYLEGSAPGFQEPTFEILNNGTFLCVMRTGSRSPMYRSFSSDGGKHWSRSEPFTPNGVMPRLMSLGNGILILVSGRPGMQLRINLSGDGKTWTEPIEMIPFMKEDGTWEQDVSCSYPDLLRVDDHTFYMVYSDFTTRDDCGEERKSILFRKIEVIKP